MERQKVGRPLDRHLDNAELDALAPSSVDGEHDAHGLSADALREAERHVALCPDCARKVLKYQQLVRGFSNALASEAATPRGHDCPGDSEVDWHEIAAGLWPELKARQLIMHAALCDHCGPLLRAATSQNVARREEQQQLKNVPLLASFSAVSHSPSRWQFIRWLAPVTALVVIVGVLRTLPSGPPTPLSGPKLAEFAVGTHRQYAQGSLPLEVRSDSQQTINEWLKEKSPFSLALPARGPDPGEERPYHLEGARLVQVHGKTAAFIAYQLQTPTLKPATASLMVAPDSVAAASGGVRVDFKKVSFHYATVEGYKVVTWSQHGLTYVLVSQESNNTQRSCMVCHSAMRDRDLSHTPGPLDSQAAVQHLRQ